MNTTAARPTSRAALRAICALSLVASVAACKGSPELTIVSPAPGATLGPSQDLDSATPGLQIAVDLTTTASDGSVATAIAGGAPAHATAQGGQIHFPSVTLADGSTTLTVDVVDSEHDKVGVTSASYSVDSFAVGCRISTPANHATLTADPGDTGLVSVLVQATCRGLASGAQVGLLENDDAALSQLQTPGPDGTVSFTADLIPGANTLSVVAPDVPYDVVEVNLASTRCRAELAPPSGSSFNLAGNDGAIADLDATTTGLQAALSVRTGCADGSPASLSISSSGTVAVTATGTVQGGVATFDVTLPDGVLDAQAFVGVPGHEGASRHAAYSSDGTAPTIVVLSPVDGGLLGAQDNLGTLANPVVRMRGQITGFDSGSFAALELDQGTAQAMEIPVSPDPSTGIFTADVPLASGTHQLFAKVVRASGNTATTAPIEFSLVVNGTALAIVSPAPSAALGLTALTPDAGGAQVVFALESSNLVGSTATVDCGSGLTATGTIGADGTVSIPITLPIASCAGALFRCSASSGTTFSAPVNFTADDTAPTASISLPAGGPTSATSTEFKATTSCAGEGQLYTLDNGGTIISTGSVQNNLIDIPSIALHSGQNQLHLAVTDAAGNSGTAEVDVTSSNNVFPSAAFVTPLAGDAYGPTSAQIDCSTPSAPVLNQVQVSISGDSVVASGLALKLTNSGGTHTVSQTPTFASGVWTWASVPILPESNTLALTATDAGGNIGQASVQFAAHCSALNVALTFAVSGSSFGYAQDKDHSTPGVQVDAQVQAGAANGSAVRLCSTAASATPGGCTTAGTGALTVVAGAATIQSGIASFTVTIPDGAQTIYAEVTDVFTEASAGKMVTARDTPPTVSSIALSEDTRGQTLGSLPDDALDQTEMDTSGGTVHFQVVFGTNSFVVGKTVQIFSTSSPNALGPTNPAVTVQQNGDGVTATTVPVALSLLNTGGYAPYVFYAVVSDDAGNKDSTPSTPVAGVAATTLGTNAAPFVIAPTPTVSLTNPVAGTSELNASNDVRCSGGVCPDTAPLIYAFAASTSAPDSAASGATSAITFLSGGSAITPGNSETNPTPTNDSAVSGVDLPIVNGTAVALAASVEDPYGNVATSSAITLLVDSIPPELAITQAGGNPVSGGAVTVNAATVAVVVSIDATSSGTLETGRTVSVFVDGVSTSNATYSGSSTGPGTVTVSLALSLGTHTLVAKTTDAAGNPGASPAVSVLQTYAGPTITLSSPAPVSGGTLWLGETTQATGTSGPICAPSLTFSTTNVPDGNNVFVWLVAAGASCGNAPGNAKLATLSGGQATLSSAPFNIADTNVWQLCAQTSDDLGNTVQTTPQTLQCDLQTPTVAWLSPAAGQTFVGFGQTQLASSTTTVSTSSSNTSLGLASAQLSIKAPAGGTLVLTVDQDNTPTTKTTQFVSCTVAATSGTQTIYALGTSNCTTTSGTGQLLLPIDYAQLLAHTLTASFTAPSGNAATSATQSVNIDVAEPAAVSPTFTVQHAIGVVQMTIPTVPGDDQTVGGNPAAWEVRYSPTNTLSSNWGGGTLVTANLAGTFPTGVPTTFQVVLPSGNATIYLGVRAKDRVGNLGDLGNNSVVQVSTQPSGSAIAIKDDSGSAPTSYGQTVMRVADLDGDGYDDVILSYPSDACENGACDGRIIVYFGGSGGVVNSAAPLVLKGKLSAGFLGVGQAFDVGDFDGDGKIDIAASEWDGGSNAEVLLWTGASIATWKAQAGSFSGALPAAPTPIVLSDSGGALVGGTVRAVGKITGGAVAGDDLAITNYQLFDGSSGPYTVAILQRGGAWSSSGSTQLFAASGSPASVFITMPSVIGTDSQFGNVDESGLEAATFTYAGASGTLPGLALSLAYIDNTTPYPGPYMNEHEARLYGGDVIAAGGTLSWSAGALLPTNSDIGPNTLYGANIAGGLDAVGDSHSDLLFADADNGQLYLYDGAQLLGTQAPTSPALPAITTYGASQESHLIGKAAALLPDLDGDGKAEIAGGSDPTSTGSPAYFWFGQNGDTTLPSLPYFASCSSATSTSFCFSPGRGQELSGSPMFSGATFGQAVLAGHITSTTGRDLVILSQAVNTSGTAPGTLVIAR